MPQSPRPLDDQEVLVAALISLDRSGVTGFRLDWNLLGAHFEVAPMSVPGALRELRHLSREGGTFVGGQARAALATVDVDGPLRERVAAMIGSVSLAVDYSVLALWSERTRQEFELAFGRDGSDPFEVADALYAPRTVSVTEQIRHGRAALQGSDFLCPFLDADTSLQSAEIESIEVEGFTAWTGTDESGHVRAKYNLRSPTLALPGRGERVAVHEDIHVIQGRAIKKRIEAGELPVGAGLTFLSSPMQAHFEGLADTAGYFDPGVRSLITPAARYWNANAVLSNLLWMRVFAAVLEGRDAEPEMQTMNRLYPNARAQQSRINWLETCVADPIKLAYQLSYGLGSYRYATAFDSLTTNESRQLVRDTVTKPLMTEELDTVVSSALQQSDLRGGPHGLRS